MAAPPAGAYLAAWSDGALPSPADETLDILESNAGHHREGGPRDAQQKQFDSDFFNAVPDDVDETDMVPPPAAQPQ